MRCNVGVHPEVLLEQHLIAEYREIPMLLGLCEYHNWKIKSPIPLIFTLGAGHINFLKVRLKYLQRRHVELIKEMGRRNIKNDGLVFDISNCPKEFCNDWEPNKQDTDIIRERIIERITNIKKPFRWWRYYGKHMKNNTMGQYIKILKESELYFV